MYKISKKFLQKLSYTDFVAFINQTNVLPGAYDTLNRWITFGKINENSFILDVACTTGFKSREISYISKCKGDAFDISKYAIENAKENQSFLLEEQRINYFLMDGHKYETDKKYTHIILGAGLGFFSNPKEILEKCIKMLDENGLILASPYYVNNFIPLNIEDEAKKILEINPTNKMYKDIMSIYLNSGLEVIYEERKDIIQESEWEMNNYVQNTTERIMKKYSFESETIEYIKNRLFSIKKICNDLRPFQKYSVIILRKREKIFPKRFIELF